MFLKPPPRVNKTIYHLCNTIAISHIKLLAWVYSTHCNSMLGVQLVHKTIKLHIPPMSFSNHILEHFLLINAPLGISLLQCSLLFQGPVCVQPLTVHLSSVVIRSLPGAWPAGQAWLGFPHVMAKTLAISMMRLTALLDILIRHF